MMEQIKSRENENIKYALKILKKSSFRNEKKQFIIEGIRLCGEAIKSNIKVHKCFYTLEAKRKFGENIDSIINYSDNKYIVTDKIIEYISDTQNPQGISCICGQVDKRTSLNKIKEYRKTVILENIQDPYNMGGILRTCDALGIDRVIISKNSCDIFSPKILRGSMGSIFRLNIDITDSVEKEIENLNSMSVVTCASVVCKNATPVTELTADKVAIVIGNEGNGITQGTSDRCKHKLTIPMSEEAESLNASVAAGILIWEITKARR